MLDNFRKCRSCGKIFAYAGRPICPNCIRKMDEDFTTVRTYIYENPGVGVEDVAEETGVEYKTIMQFLKEGRLQLKSADGALVCEKCGRPLTSGTLCDSCRKELAGTLDESIAKPAAEGFAKSQKKESGGLKDERLHVNVLKRQGGGER